MAELRKRLIYILVFFVCVFIISLVFAGNIYELLTSGFDKKLLVLSPSEILHIYLLIAGWSSIVFSLPFIAYHIWAFVAPGLKRNEAKVLLGYVPAVFVCFVIGFLFGLLVVSPLLLSVLLGLGKGIFDVQITAYNYLLFVIHTTVPLGVLFELPVVIAFLTSLSILTPKFLIKNRKYAYFILLVIAVCITPPDFASDLITTIPLVLIYELGVIISKVVYRRKKVSIQKEE